MLNIACLLSLSLLRPSIFYLHTLLCPEDSLLMLERLLMFKIKPLLNWSKISQMHYLLSAIILIRIILPYHLLIYM